MAPDYKQCCGVTHYHQPHGSATPHAPHYQSTDKTTVILTHDLRTPTGLSESIRWFPVSSKVPFCLRRRFAQRQRWKPFSSTLGLVDPGGVASKFLVGSGEFPPRCTCFRVGQLKT